MCFLVFLFINVADLSESVSAHYVSVHSSILDWLFITHSGIWNVSFLHCSFTQRFLFIEPEDRMNCKSPLPCFCLTVTGLEWTVLWIWLPYVIHRFFVFFTIWLMLFVFGVFICFFHFLKLWNCFHWCLYTINKYIHKPKPRVQGPKKAPPPLLFSLCCCKFVCSVIFNKLDTTLLTGYLNFCHV